MKTLITLYAKLLKLYPNAYNQEYAKAMQETLSDMIEGAPSRAAKRQVLARAFLELPIYIFEQNLIYLGGTYVHETPAYIKRSGQVAGLLLVPFLAAISANFTSRVITGHSLYSTWVWSYPILLTWVLILPTIALIISGAAFVAYLLDTTHFKQKNFINKAFDLSHNWPVVLFGCVAICNLLIVKFHDAGPCLIQNPVSVMHYWNSFWACTNR